MTVLELVAKLECRLGFEYVQGRDLWTATLTADYGTILMGSSVDDPCGRGKTPQDALRNLVSHLRGGVAYGASGSEFFQIPRDLESGWD